MSSNELPKPGLSRREREVAALVAEGLTNREIAKRLFISERTADGHLEHIREKLAVTSRAQVAAWFVTESQPGAAVAAPPPQDRRANSIRIPIAVATVGVVILVAVVAVNRLQTPPAATGPIITTVAGTTRGYSVLGGYSGDFGPATSAQFSRPQDVAVSADGYLYIADTGNQLIRRVDDQGNIRTFAGGPTASFVEGRYALSTSIGQVLSVAVSPGRVLYFSNGSLVAHVDPPYRLVNSLMTAPIISPWGICFAQDGTLYIADTFADKVWRRSPNGALSIYAGDGTHGFGGDGAAATGAQLRYPTSLALDQVGNLYIADTGNDRIRRVDAKTRMITTVAGSSDTYGYSGDGGLADKAELSLPFGVALGPNGDIYIADTGNNRIRRVDAKTQVITTVAGTGIAGFAGDGGAATTAELDGPYALAVDGSGNLLIVDTGNQRIRMIRGGALG